MIICGDCLEVMRGMEPNSIDAVICDPPYGLEFMGKEWDAPWKYGMSSFGYSDGGNRNAAPGFNSSRNPMCRICHKHKRGSVHHIPCACVKPDFDDVDHRLNDMARLQSWHYAWAAEALRVAKSGCHLLAFGGTRTFHRLICAIEDAGWEIRDCLGWLYGSGFPKSHNLKGEHEGWGTALKPAWEPIVLARKPLDGTVATNVQKWGTGAVNVDGCRVGTGESTLRPDGKCKHGKESHSPALGASWGGDGFSGGNPKGRWPANICHDGSEEVLELFPQTKSVRGNKGELADIRGGNLVSSNGRRIAGSDSERGFSDSGSAARFFFCAKNKCQHCNGTGHHISGDYYWPWECEYCGGSGDSGSAARFFYCAKASRKEREMGCEGMEEKSAPNPNFGSGGFSRPTGQPERETTKAKNNHPTVKPLALMRYLCRLVTPPNGLILDPFCGSGSTGVAANQEGFRFIGIDNNAEYCEIAKRRITPLAPPLSQVADPA